jgi:hypothetical protein
MGDGEAGHNPEKAWSLGKRGGISWSLGLLEIREREVGGLGTFLGISPRM